MLTSGCEREKKIWWEVEVWLGIGGAQLREHKQWRMERLSSSLVGKDIEGRDIKEDGRCVRA